MILAGDAVREFRSYVRLGRFYYYRYYKPLPVFLSLDGQNTVALTVSGRAPQVDLQSTPPYPELLP